MARLKRVVLAMLRQVVRVFVIVLAAFAPGMPPPPPPPPQGTEQLDKDGQTQKEKE